MKLRSIVMAGLLVAAMCPQARGADHSIDHGTAADEAGMNLYFSAEFDSEDLEDTIAAMEKAGDGALAGAAFPLPKRIRTFMVNKQGGPLAVHWTAATVDGEAVQSWEDMKSAMGGSLNIQGVVLGAEAVLEAGRKLELFEVEEPGRDFNFVRVKLQTCYCSTESKECWTVGLPYADFPETLVKSCQGERPAMVLSDSQL